ncbi:YVTN repeat-like/Quino protein amine dehydrogenase [Suillus decipiens]|nr:YVTN repeat-like/Quino protein amine dehydrogenase [Suillus decipiens]
MASSSTRPIVTLEGHEPYVIHYPEGKHHEYKNVSSISYFPDGKQMISGSGDKTIRRWNLRDGKEIEKARGVCENRINAVGVSRDGRWVVAAGWQLKVSEVETGIVRTFNEGDWIDCIDISADSTLLASAHFRTVRIWNLNTGEIVAGPFNLDDHNVGHISLRFSEDSRKLAVMSYWKPYVLQVWDVQTQKLVVQKSTPDILPMHLTVPVFWTTKDKSIVTAFTFTRYFPTTIYEFDASTLKTVGAPFKGDTDFITNLALSHDSVLLASSSFDAIKLWAFQSRQLLASFDVTFQILSLVLSPDSRQLAYTNWDNTNIYICNIPANVLASIGLAEEPQPSFDVIPRPVHCKPVIVPIVSSIPRPLPTRDPRTFKQFLRNLLSSRMDTVRTGVPRDPLDFPATSPLPRPLINPNGNSRSTPAPLTTQSPFTSHSHRLSMRWPFRTRQALPAIDVVDVPLAPAKLRYAAAGAPSNDDDSLIRDEDYVPPPSHNPGSRSGSVNTGEHGKGRFCFCL